MAKSRIWLIRLGALVFAIILGGLVFMIAGANSPSSSADWYS